MMNKASAHLGKKRVEKILHSRKVMFGEVEILHEHLPGTKPKQIRFSAWRINDPLNKKGLLILQEDITEDFFDHHQTDFVWLVDSES